MPTLTHHMIKNKILGDYNEIAPYGNGNTPFIGVV